MYVLETISSLEETDDRAVLQDVLIELNYSDSYAERTKAVNSGCGLSGRP